MLKLFGVLVFLRLSKTVLALSQHTSTCKSAIKNTRLMCLVCSELTGARLELLL